MPRAPSLLYRLLVAALPLGAAGGIGQDAEAPFRTSLTATVIIGPAPVAGKHDRAAGRAALGCREVILRWAERRGARRFAVYASARADGPWSELPATNVCGAVQRPVPTQLIDVEPTQGAAAVVHRLYYKVVALAGDAPGAAPLDVTDPVAVELPS